MTDFMLPLGIEGHKEIVVNSGMLATAYSSGTQEVLATPALIALMEQAAMESVQLYLPESFTTVGTHVDVYHENATLPGERITIHSKLLAVDGRKLTFEVAAYGSHGRIGRGVHERHVIDSERFIRKLNERKSL